MDTAHNEGGQQQSGNFLSGGGEMGARMRAFDWSNTPLGSIEKWPQSLKTAVRIMLTSRQPMWLGWGEQLIKLYNDAYKTIVGGKHPEALGQPASVVWREIWNDIAPMLETAMGGIEGTYVEAQLLIMERSGYPEETYYTFSYSPIPDDEGGTGGIICANTDDTQRVLGERQLRTLRELAAETAEAKTVQEACELSASALSRNLYDLPFTLLYLLDAESKSAHLAGATGMEKGTAVSPHQIKIIGRDADGWPLGSVFENNESVLLTDLTNRFGSLPGGPWPEPSHSAMVLPIAQPGQAMPTGFLIAGISPRRALDDKYKGFLELVAGQVATAVGDARAYEAERERAEALIELDRAKTAFFSNVSHEFRTPLTLMLGPLEDALASNLDPAQKRELEVVHRNGLRLLKLVNTLLDFSRIEAGRVQAVYEPTDLSGFTAELASMFRSAIERAGMQLVVDCPPIAEPVYVDREMWEKIIMNLLSNAFKFTLEGRIAVSLRGTQGQVELRVRDTGTGISETELPHLFERFHRIRGAQARTHEGTGIGLALVRELVTLHGGSIQVESKIEKGTTFIVTIPIGSAHLPADRIGAERTALSATVGAQAYVEEALHWISEDFGAGKQSAQVESLNGDSQPAGVSARILLADDNSDMREYIKRILSAHNWRVEVVSDGEAALEAARERIPDLVLSDVMMPRMDGFELLRELRSDPVTREVPVILLSARAGEESRIEGLEAGADDYLVKPFSARELLARVSAHLQLASMRKESQEQVKNILESITDGFVALDQQWRYNYINAEAERMGLDRAELLGKTLWEAFPSAVTVNIEEKLRRAANEQIAVEFEGRNEESGRWYANKAYPAADGGLTIYFRDITQRKRAEEALRANEAQLQTLFDEAPLGIYLVDSDFRIRRVNPTALPVFGDIPDLIGRDFDEVIHILWSNEYADEIVQLFRRTLETGEPYITPEQIKQRRDRNMTEYYEWQINRIPLPEGGYGVVCYFRDIAAQVFARQEIEQLLKREQQARAEAEEANRLKDEFLATVSHELRNPLNAMLGWSRMLNSSNISEETAKRGLTAIERNAKAQAQLVEDLLDVSRIVSGKLRLNVRPVQLVSVIEDAIDTIRPAADAREIRLQASLDPDAGPVAGDSQRLQQVVWNLLSNAVKFTPKGGRVQVRLARINSHIEIVVSDTGQGIAAEFLPYVFDRFRQADGSISRAYSGLGLGLAIVRHLVELHGGSSHADSPGKDQGAIFTVKLPLMAIHMKSDEERIHPRVSEGAGLRFEQSLSLSGVRVLVVDDEPDTLLLLNEVLTSSGATVRMALSAEEGLAEIKTSPPQVIVSDIGMPGEDGYAFMKRVRAWGKESGVWIPAVALTAYARAEDRMKALSSGYQIHVPKPVEPSELIAVIVSLVERPTVPWQLAP